MREILLHAHEVAVCLHTPDLVRRTCVRSKAFHIATVACLIERGRVLHRKPALHLAGDQAVFQQCRRSINADAIVGESTQVAPRLLIKQQPVPLNRASGFWKY